MTIIRRIGAIALAAPLAMSFPVLAALPAQAASTSVITPADGAVISSGSQVTAKAHFDFAITMQLRVDGPGIGDTFLQEKGLSGDMSGTFSISRNGRYKVYLLGKQTNHVYDSNTFTVRIAPAAPTGVSASASGGKLVVKWNRGLEDDLTGYALAGSGVKSKSGSLNSLCSGTSCSATLPLTRSTGAASVGVKAIRSTGTGGSLYSGIASATASLGGGTGSAPGSGSVPSLPSGGSGVPSTGTPLTPFNNNSPVTLPSVQPDGATPGFTYPAPQIATDSPKAQNIAATDRLQWGKSVGIALVLLIVAAHLGTWTRRLRVAQAGTSSNGMAARIARSGTGRRRVSKSREQIARAEALAKTAPVVAAGAKGARSSKRATRTAVLDSKPKAGRRPATLGKPSGGVNVRLANSGTKTKPKRGRRRK